MRIQNATQLFVAAIVLLCCSPLAAQNKTQGVDLFEAMDAGQVAVKFIPANAAKANVLIENVTNRVLHIQLPDAIAAVPVLAQFGPDPGEKGGGGAGAQGVGGGLNFGGPNAGFNGQGGNGFGNGGGQRQDQGMGFMRIEPEKTRKLTARTVCLEHGKPDPNPRINYRMIPIDKFTDSAKVAELCRQLGRGELEQKTAQAAAWHLANGLSWERIAGINRIESKYLGNIRFFQPKELAGAKEFVTSFSITSDASLDDYATAR